MSHQIDPKDVLIYLNDLGYKNISAQQLKEFIKDLIKLLKYEERNSKDSKIHIQENSEKSGRQQFYDSHYENSVKENFTRDAFFTTSNDKFEALYNKQTVASRCKQHPRKERQILVQITKPNAIGERSHQHPHCVHVEEEPNKDIDFIFIQNENKLKSLHPNSKVTLDSGVSVKTVLTNSSIKDSENKSKKSKNVILSCPVRPSNKSDPVALYHFYQNMWKKTSIPGETSRSDLRWTVRERMMGCPKSRARSSSSIRTHKTQ